MVEAIQFAWGLVMIVVGLAIAFGIPMGLLAFCRAAMIESIIPLRSKRGEAFWKMSVWSSTKLKEMYGSHT